MVHGDSNHPQSFIKSHGKHSGSVPENMLKKMANKQPKIVMDREGMRRVLWLYQLSFSPCSE